MTRKQYEILFGILGALIIIGLLATVVVLLVKRKESYDPDEQRCGHLTKLFCNDWWNCYWDSNLKKCVSKPQPW